MGLDTYAVDLTAKQGALNNQQKGAFMDMGINLVGGMFSGCGNEGSFRGKVYADLVYAATRVDLYDEEVSVETVYGMVEDIDRAIKDLTELRKFFQVCKEQGLGLYNWY